MLKVINYQTRLQSSPYEGYHISLSYSSLKKDRIRVEYKHMRMPTFSVSKIVKFVFWLFVVLLCAFSLSVFYYYKFDKNLEFRCASEFSSPEEYVDSVARWTSSYLKDHPNATQEEIRSERVKLLKEFNCGESTFEIPKDIKQLVNTKEITKTNEVYETYNSKPYEFVNFPVSFKKYKAAEVKFEGDFKLKENPNYWNDWKEIFSNIDDEKIDFAGHFKLVNVGNGTMRDLYIVDGLTGTIYSEEKITSTGPSEFLFKNDSRLLVLIMDNEFGFIPQTKESKVYFYYVLQDDHSFKMLGAYIYKNNKFIKVNI